MKTRHLLIIALLTLILLASFIWNVSIHSVEGLISKRRLQKAETAVLNRNLAKRKEQRVQYANEDTQGKSSEIRDIVSEKPTNAIVKQKDDKLSQDLAKFKEEAQQQQQAQQQQ